MDGISTQVSTTGVAGALASNQVARGEQQRRTRAAHEAQRRGDVVENADAPDAPLESASEIVDINSNLPDRLGEQRPLTPPPLHAKPKPTDDTPKRPRLNVTA